MTDRQRWVETYSDFPPRYRRASRPKEKCPNCGQYELYEEQYVKSQRFFLWRWLKLVETRKEEELGWTTLTYDCDNCGYMVENDG